MRIVYTVVPCRLGRLLLAGTAHGISALYLGDTDKPLEEALFREYPHASLARDDTTVPPWVVEIVHHIDRGGSRLDLPLDLQATTFQWAVWRRLQGIPAGTTQTYKQIAEDMGTPTAARAVARACATNPVSVVIPCHRVLRGDGGLGGYRWGIHRKRALIDVEREANEPGPSK